MSAKHLRVVEFDDNGELVEETCPECRRRIDELAGLERVIRSQAAQIQALMRDKAAEAREHPLWPVGRALFGEWRARCRHPRSPWTPDRFWVWEPFATNVKYGQTLDLRVALCRRAIAGAAFDAFVTTRRNQTTKRHDAWDLIYRSADKFEEFCCKAPRDWQPGDSIDAGEGWTLIDVERALVARRAA